jgi:hypothetical protein
MLSTHLTAVLALTTLSAASALPNAKRDSTILKLPVTTVNQTCPSLSKRQDPVSLANTQTGTSYLISCKSYHGQTPTACKLNCSSSLYWNPRANRKGGN